jgi:hypothetical protein
MAECSTALFPYLCPPPSPSPSSFPFFPISLSEIVLMRDFADGLRASSVLFCVFYVCVSLLFAHCFSFFHVTFQTDNRSAIGLLRPTRQLLSIILVVISGSLDDGPLFYLFATQNSGNSSGKEKTNIAVIRLSLGVSTFDQTVRLMHTNTPVTDSIVFDQF